MGIFTLKHRIGQLPMLILGLITGAKHALMGLCFLGVALIRFNLAPTRPI